MTENVYEAAHLRVHPQAIPALREAFSRALDRLEPEIVRLGHIQGVWLGDPVSRQVVDFYNNRVMDAVDGA